MRILQIGNISGVASTLSQELGHRGLHSDVLVFERSLSKFGYPNDYVLSGVAPVVILEALLKAREYDLVHWHFPRQRNTIALYSRFKPLLKHYHGSDLRGKREEGFCLVAMPELLDYAPNAIYMPHPINLEQVTPKYETTNRVPLICWYRSTVTRVETVKAAEQSLKNESVFLELKDYSHNEALQVISNCDVFLDLRTNGWYGLSSAEAMSAGKPVISDIRADFAAKYAPAVVPSDKYGSLIETLHKLLNDTELRVEMGSASREYAVSNHDVHKAVDMLIPLYQRLIERRPEDRLRN